MKIQRFCVYLSRTFVHVVDSCRIAITDSTTLTHVSFVARIARHDRFLSVLWKSCRMIMHHRVQIVICFEVAENFWVDFIKVGQHWTMNVFFDDLHIIITIDVTVHVIEAKRVNKFVLYYSFNHATVALERHVLLKTNLKLTHESKSMNWFTFWPIFPRYDEQPPPE